jgi:hypothetical protein
MDIGMEDGRMEDDRISPPFGNGMAGPPSGAGLTVGDGMLPPLPIGLDSFPEIREKGYIYVDKTKYIADLLKNNGRIFCARPRRFGKSLTISTIQTIFSEKPEDRAFFEGLDIAPHLSEPIFEPRPVIRLDMNCINIEGAESLPSGLSIVDDAKMSVLDSEEVVHEYKEQLLRYISSVACELNIEPEGKVPSEIFRNLIRTLSNKKKTVVILVDEYDYPLVQSIRFPIIQDKIRSVLRSLYMQIKASNRYIYFVFFAGISKFSKVGIFSELNILNDISIDERYAAMYGYTQEELDKYFGGYIDSIASRNKDTNKNIRKGILEYYDGYTFDGRTHVYNPISILQFMNVGDFRNYWIQTGSQQFVEWYFHGKEIDWESFEGGDISCEDVTSPKDVGLASTPQTLLYQSGYLTIRETSNKEKFKLVYPNIEVRNAMRSIIKNNFFNNFFNSIDDATTVRNNIYKFFKTDDYEGIIKIFNNMLSGIPEKHRRTTKSQDSGKKEDFYNGQIARFLLGAGFDTQPEDHSNKGIADIVAKCDDKALVIEGKYVDLDQKKTISRYKIESDCRAKLADAVSQIYNQNYADKYGTPMRLAIVYDESHAARISHVVYNETAFHLYGKKPDFNKIGKVVYDGLIWKLSYTSEITASKEPLSPAEILAITMSKKAEGAKKTYQKDDKFPIAESDGTVSDSDMTLCRLVMPQYQFASFENGLKETGDEGLINTLKRIAQAVNKTQSTSFWHTLSKEEKNKAFQDALEAKTSVTLSYLTADGTFSLTAVDFSRGEAIGLLVTSTRKAAYGPYPLSRLVDDSSRLQSSFVKASLSNICKEQGVDETGSLPTPQQFLKRSKKK